MGPQNVPFFDKDKSNVVKHFYYNHYLLSQFTIISQYLIDYIT